MDKYYKPGEKVNNYSIIKILGEGRYGIVYLAENDQQEKCIIKQLKNKMLEVTRNKLFYEEKLLMSLDSPQFPKFIGKFKDQDVEGYVMEYMRGRVFEDLLFIDNYQFTKKEIFEVADKLLDIISILHQNHIVHRDIRPPNVIVQDNHQLVLIDFGLARYIDGKRYSEEQDYWYLGDFLIHLYYSSYNLDTKDSEAESEEKPWYEELVLTDKEKSFLKKLMGLEGSYTSLEEIHSDLEILKSIS